MARVTPNIDFTLLQSIIDEEILQFDGRVTNYYARCAEIYNSRKDASNTSVYKELIYLRVQQGKLKFDGQKKKESSVKPAAPRTGKEGEYLPAIVKEYVEEDTELHRLTNDLRVKTGKPYWITHNNESGALHLEGTQFACLPLPYLKWYLVGRLNEAGVDRCTHKSPLRKNPENLAVTNGEPHVM